MVLVPPPVEGLRLLGVRMGDVVSISSARVALPSFRPSGGGLTELGVNFLRDFGPRLASSTVATFRRVLYVASHETRGVSPLPEHPSPADVARWLSALQVAGYAGGTVQLWRGHLHHVYQTGVACLWCSGNPVAAVPWKRLDAQRRALVDVKGVWPFLLAVCVDARERAFMSVLRFGGLRRGEALGLEARHIDFAANTVTVDQQRTKPNSRETTRRLKSEASRRQVPMRAELREVLAELLEGGATVEIRSGFGGGKREVTALLFPYNVYQLADFMQRLRGVVPDGFPPKDAWHVFRHTVAVELYRAGKDVEAIRQFLGHVSLEKTATYLRSLVGARINASVIEGLDDVPERSTSDPPGKTLTGASTPVRGAARKSVATRSTKRSETVVQPAAPRRKPPR